MRYRFTASRLTGPALALALAATVAACSSSASTPASTSSSSSAPAVSSSSAPAASTPATMSSSPATGSASGAAGQVKSNWEAFFSGKTPAAKKISLLQNGQQFASVIRAQAGSGLATSVSAKVTSVTVTSPTSATVKYNIVSGSQTLLPNQTGTAVKQGGTWKVGDVSFCQLLKLQGTTPPMCKA